jgi:hypothetical protein
MPQAPTLLRKSRDEARRLLQERLDEPLKIADDVRSSQEWERAVAREKLWREYNVQLLEALFTTPEYADEYRNSTLSLRTVKDHYYEPSFETLKLRLVASIRSQIGKLQSIINRIELIEEQSGAPRSEQPPDKASWLATLTARFHLVARQIRRRHAGRA